MLSRFYLIPERYGRMDGRDGQICYINIARQYADDKKTECLRREGYTCAVLTPLNP